MFKVKVCIEYENILYLECFGCNLCMGNQEKVEKGDMVLVILIWLFQGCVVEDVVEKKGELFLVLILVVVLLVILGCIFSVDEYKVVVEGIELIKFVLSLENLGMVCLIQF